jgi:hypothetical protein
VRRKIDRDNRKDGERGGKGNKKNPPPPEEGGPPEEGDDTTLTGFLLVRPDFA